MATKDHVKLWVLDYACRFQHHAVIEAISERYDGDLREVGIPALRLAEAALSMIVIKERFEDFDAAIQLVQAIHDRATEAVPFKLYAKLISGLKMKVLFHLLAADKPNILEKLNGYFPRAGLQYPNVSKKVVSMLNTSQFQFRKFFLPLLANENQRLAYLRDEYCEEYGEEFMECLRSLVKEFIEVVEKHLPPTMLEKLMNAASDGVNLESKLKHKGVQSAEVEIVLDAIMGQTSLTSETLLELLTMVSPVNTEDRVLVPHLAPFTDHLDSFSEDSGTDQTPPVDSAVTTVTEQTEMRSENRQENTSPNCDTSVPMHSTQASRTSKTLERNSLGVAKNSSSKSRKCVNSVCDETINQTSTVPVTHVTDHDLAVHCESGKSVDKTGKSDMPDENKKPRTWCGVPLTNTVTPCDSPVVAKGSNSERQKSARCSSQRVAPYSVPSVSGENSHKTSDRRTSARENCNVLKNKTPSSDTAKKKRRSSRGRPSRRGQRIHSNTADTSDEDVAMRSDTSGDDNGHAFHHHGNSHFSGSDTGSISDIDRSSDMSDVETVVSDQDIVPGSEETESESHTNGRVSELRRENRDRATLKQLISPYRKSSQLKLCVVKVFRNQEQDVCDEETGKTVNIYS